MQVSDDEKVKLFKEGVAMLKEYIDNKDKLHEITQFILNEKESLLNLKNSDTATVKNELLLDPIEDKEMRTKLHNIFKTVRMHD